MGPASDREKARRGEERSTKDKRSKRNGEIAQAIGSEAVRQGEEEEEKEGGTNNDLFHNYKPPLRLIILELIVIILLVLLLLFEPNGFTAISMKGTDTVGLLSSCSGSTCTSWLGAPASGGGGTTTAAKKRAPSDSSSPTSFHLQTGLAAFCSFILVLYAFLFHILRAWKEEPAREGGEDPHTLEAKMKNSWIRRRVIGKTDASGFKRFGYRLSRLFTGVNVVLLLCVCISAGLQASSGGFNTGFVLLIIAWVMLLLVALLEFMNDKRKIKGWLMVKKGWRPPMPSGCCGGSGKAKTDKETIDDEETGRGDSRDSRSRSRPPR